ncbi:MAG: flagellar motor switch protein FliN [Endozoicomonas sp. (ex Botrylloides leachii)]|nr:flagellar motor switch protein FliN [Endozoicomonas sp. (ex Botrylloides leachii)]
MTKGNEKNNIKQGDALKNPPPGSKESFKDTLKTEQPSIPDTNNIQPQSLDDLAMILDIPVTLSLELGSTKINVSDLMQLNKGSIVELEKEASEPMEVMVNGTLIAYAEVVVINEKYGIRFLDVISKSERLKKLT